MGGLIVAGEVKTPDLIHVDMLVFVYASSEHDCNYKYSLDVQPRILRFDRVLIGSLNLGYQLILGVATYEN